MRETLIKKELRGRRREQIVPRRWLLRESVPDTDLEVDRVIPLPDDGRNGQITGDVVHRRDATEDTIERAATAVKYHVDWLDLMGFDRSLYYGINVHIWATYGDKGATADRFYETIEGVDRSWGPVDVRAGGDTGNAVLSAGK